MLLYFGKSNLYATFFWKNYILLFNPLSRLRISFISRKDLTNLSVHIFSSNLVVLIIRVKTACRSGVTFPADFKVGVQLKNSYSCYS